VSEVHIKVLEKQDSIPTKIAIGERTYDVIPKGCVGEAMVEIEQVKNVKLKEIPESLCLYNYTPELFYTINMFKGQATMVIVEVPKYYDELMPLNDYFDLIKNIAGKMGCKVVSEDRKENQYFMKLTKDFTEDTTVLEVYEVFGKLNAEIISTMNQLNAQIISALNQILKFVKSKS
jgi:hypothetical protein